MAGGGGALAGLPGGGDTRGMNFRAALAPGPGPG